MALSCSNSYIDATDACNGRVLVHLTHDDGSPFFDSFDVFGGPANNVSQNTTGFTAGSTLPPYTLDFDVMGEPAGFQCFFINYNVGSHTSDSLIIQPTDTNNQPLGNACELSFSVPTQTECDDGPPTGGSCIENNVLPTGVLTPSDFATGATAFATPDTSIIVAQFGIDVISVSATEIEIECLVGNTSGQGSITVRLSDGTQCTSTIDCNNDPDPDPECIVCEDIQIRNVNSTTLSAGDTLTFETNYSGPLSTSVIPLIFSQAGPQLGQATFLGTLAGGWNQWSFDIPSQCNDGFYEVSLFSFSSDPAGCPRCDLFDIQLVCSEDPDPDPDPDPEPNDPVIDQCVNGSVALQAGIGRTLTASNCTGDLTWSSSSNQISFSTTTGGSTIATALTSGNFPITVTCCYEE